MSSDRTPDTQLQLVYALREALASRSKVSVEFEMFTVNGVFIDLAEINSGRSALINSATILADENDSRLEVLNDARAFVKFHTATGFFELQIIANFIDSGVPLIKVVKFLDVQAHAERRRLRSVVGSIPKSFVVVTNGVDSSIASFELRDVSVGAAGGILRTPTKLSLAVSKISGFISSGSSSLRFNEAPVIRFDETPKKEGSVFAYSVAVEIQNTNAVQTLSEKRKFSRQEQDRFSLIEIQSSLFAGVSIPIRVTDISTAGFSGKIVDEKDIALLPFGCEIIYKGLSGEIVFNKTDQVRVKWLFDSDSAHKVWQETIARLAEHDIDIRSYESQSTLTLLARSGLKSSKFITNYHTAKSMVPGFGEIERSGDPVVYRAVQRDTSGVLETHIGSFKIADNLWFNGDLFGAQGGKANSTKEFVQGYFERFIEFAQASRPYPKIISAWVSGHPYWKKLETSLENEGKHLVIATASVHTILPDVNCLLSIPNKLEILEVQPSDSNEINRIRSSAVNLGTDAFLSAFDFDKDRFASPLLRMSLERNNYKFRRNYFSVKTQQCEFLAVVSQMPEGLSPQRHQNAVWVICSAGIPNKKLADDVVNEVIFLSTKMGTFPSVIRFVGPDLTSVTDKKNIVVIADPKMWRLAA